MLCFLYRCRLQLEQALRERTALNNRVAKMKEDMDTMNRKVQLIIVLCSIVAQSDNVYFQSTVQDRALARGESQYRDREEDIRVLKMEIRRLRQDEVSKRTSIVHETNVSFNIK